jgi:hypothetical protein
VSLRKCIIVEHWRLLPPINPSISRKCPSGSRLNSSTIATGDRAADVAHVHAAHRDHLVSRVLMHPMDCPAKSVTLDHPDHRQAISVNKQQ